MIIFDLDGTLADCEHRRHFIEAPEDHCTMCYVFLMSGKAKDNPDYECECGRKPGVWRCDWKAFYKACDKDKPIKPTIKIFNQLLLKDEKLQVWSGRCESVREKTEQWLVRHTLYSSKYCFEINMRPIGDNTPDEMLKERWLDEYLESMYPKLELPTEESMNKVYRRESPIEFVVDDRPKVVRMWRRRGIFVFDVNQRGLEF